MLLHDVHYALPLRVTLRDDERRHNDRWCGQCKLLGVSAASFTTAAMFWVVVFSSLWTIIFFVCAEPFVRFLVLDLNEAVLDDDHEDALDLAHGEEHVHVCKQGTKQQAAIRHVLVELVYHVTTLERDQGIKRSVKAAKAVAIIIKKRHAEKDGSEHDWQEADEHVKDLRRCNSQGAQDRVVVLCVLEVLHYGDPDEKHAKTDEKLGDCQIENI